MWDFLEPSHHSIVSFKAAANEESGRKIAEESGRRSALSLEDQLFMVMVRPRLGRLQEELAYMFGVDPGMASRILNTWLSYRYLRFGLIPIWPSWEAVAATMPAVFQMKYPDTYAIIDATELVVERPSSQSLQAQLYSSYKSHCNVKCLVGISPNGMVTFISQFYTGSIIDRQLVQESKILPCLKRCHPGRMSLQMVAFLFKISS